MLHGYLNKILSSENSLGSLENEHWGVNLHLGYWDETTNPDYSPIGFFNASNRMNEIVLLHSGIKSGDTVLDVGCGFGGTIKFLDQILNPLELIGVNNDLKQLERATCHVLTGMRNKFNLMHACASHLPLPDNSVDVVLAVECVFHFPGRDKFLREAYRVLKKGGKLFISDFVKKKRFNQRCSKIIRNSFFFNEIRPFHLISHHRYSNLFDDSRLRDIQKINITNHIKLNFDYLIRNSVDTASLVESIKMETVFSNFDYMIFTGIK